MDYSVGSLADLITGKNTPNKPKVVVKKITPKRKSITPNANANESLVGLNKTPNKRRSSIALQETSQENGIATSGGKKKKNKLSFSAEELDQSGKAKSPVKNKKKNSISNENVESQIEDSSTNISESKSPGRKRRNSNTPKIKANKKRNSITNESVVPPNEDKNDGEKSEELSNGIKKEKFTEKKSLKRRSTEPDDEPTKSPKKPKLSKSEKNAAKRVLYKERELKKDNPDEQARTIYVGNIPILTNLDKTKAALKKHFRQYGIIDSIRFRGIPVADPKTPKKVAAIKSKLNPKRKTIYGYIKFINMEDANKAQVENGSLFNEHHLRVHGIIKQEDPDESKAIFVGNLSFEAEEDELWKLFETCGAIDNIRIIRDKKTGMGKGFAYINFVNADSVQLALELEQPQLKNRELRISLCNLNVAKKNKKKNKINKPGSPKKFWFKKNKGKKVDGKNQNGENKPFQGSKFTDKNKRKKVNKGEQHKKRLIKKIAPKTE